MQNPEFWGMHNLNYDLQRKIIEYEQNKDKIRAEAKKEEKAYYEGETKRDRALRKDLLNEPEMVARRERQAREEVIAYAKEKRDAVHQASRYAEELIQKDQALRDSGLAHEEKDKRIRQLEQRAQEAIDYQERGVRELFEKENHIGQLQDLLAGQDVNLLAGGKEIDRLNREIAEAGREIGRLRELNEENLRRVTAEKEEQWLREYNRPKSEETQAALVVSDAINKEENAVVVRQEEAVARGFDSLNNNSLVVSGESTMDDAVTFGAQKRRKRDRPKELTRDAHQQEQSAENN
jgi:hypothetical protein